MKNMVQVWLLVITLKDKHAQDNKCLHLSSILSCSPLKEIMF